jgi:hypothetical protein
MTFTLPAQCQLCNSMRWCGRPCAQAKHVPEAKALKRAIVTGAAIDAEEAPLRRALAAHILEVQERRQPKPRKPKIEAHSPDPEVRELEMAKKRSKAKAKKARKAKPSRKTAKRVTKRRVVKASRKVVGNGTRRGRPPENGEKAMTDAERAKRYRERKAKRR